MVGKICGFLCIWIMFCANDIYAVDRVGYVCNRQDQTVTPINLSTNTSETPISVDSRPFYIAITPDGHTAYVTCPLDDQVIPIDLITNTPEPPIVITSSSQSPSTLHINRVTQKLDTLESTGSSGPTGIAITPDGTTAYVANVFDNSVAAINLKTKTLAAVIPIDETPIAIAITPDGRIAYVANADTNDVIPIDIATNTLGLRIPVGKGPISLAITPDGRTLYVVNKDSNNITPIDVATNTPRMPISVGDKPLSIAITPDGQLAYVANGDSNDVTPIDLVKNIPKTRVPVRKGPTGVTINPDDQHVYVVNEFSNSISTIDIASNKAEAKAISVGTRPVSFVIVPDQAPVASFTAQTVLWGLVKFHASDSYSPTGNIISYKWDFGDSHTEETTNPEIYHNYSRHGPHKLTVTLTVTNSAGTSTNQVFTGQTMSLNGGSSAVTSHTVQVKF